MRDALGGATAFDVRHYLIAFVPSSLLVLVQESGTFLGEPHVIVISAVLQHLVAAVSLPLSVFLARRGITAPVWLCLLVWAVTGVLRALVGAGVAVAAGAEADLLARILLWIAVLCIWAPVTGYAFAQFERRRLLLGILQHEQTELALPRADERGRDHVRAEIVAAISARVSPVVDDIRAGLSRLHPGRAEQVDPALLGSIGDRLASVADEVDDAVRRLSVSPPSPPLRLDAPPAPLQDAMVLLRRNPLLEAALAAAAQLAVLLPLAGLGSGSDELRPILAVTSGVLAGQVVLVLLRWTLLARRRRRRALVLMSASLLLGGLVSSAVALLLLGAGAGVEGSLPVVLATMPLLFAYGSGVIIYAGGAGAGNRAVAERLLQLEQLREARDRELESDERSLRDELEALTHGPIQGRLAACAMALNFYAADFANGAAPVGGPAADRAVALADSVIQHLDAVSADLRDLQRAGR